MLLLLLWLTTAQADERVYKAQDIWDARCDVGCQRGEHAQGGYYVPHTRKCRCYDDFDAERVTHRKLTLSGPAPGDRIIVEEGTNMPYVPKDQDTTITLP